MKHRATTPTRRRAGALALVVGLSLLGVAAASAAGPTAKMTPDNGLVDNTLTTVTASGLPPNSMVYLVECSGTVAAPPKDATSCDAFGEDINGSSDIRGNFRDAPGENNGTSGFHVRILPAPQEHGMVIRCDANNPCVLYVGANLEDFRAPHAFLALNFASSAVGKGSTPATATPDPSGGSNRSTIIAVVVIAAAALAGLIYVLWRRRNAAGQPSA